MQLRGVLGTEKSWRRPKVRGRRLCALALVLVAFEIRAGWFDTGDMLMARRRVESAYRVYGELKEVEGVPRDGLLFRLAECEMEMDERTLAVEHYKSLLARCPRSPYALEARFRLVAEELQSPDLAVRRKAVGDVLGFCYGAEPTPLAEEAAVAAATACYNSTWYHEARLVASRMLRRRPQGDQAAVLRRLQRWSAYKEGDFEALKKLCGESEDDEAVYLRAAVALAEGRDAEAREGLYAYLADQPEGQYRSLAQTSLAQLLFAAAAANEKAGQVAEALGEYDQIIRDFPGADAEEAMFRKGTLEFRQGSWSNVCETLSALMATNAASPRRGTALYLHGVAEWKIGNSGAASNLVSEALAAGLPPDCAAEARYVLDFLSTNGLSRTQTEQLNHE